MRANDYKEEVMALRVNNNVAAMNAYRNLTVSDSQMGKSLEKLSSGYRINRAGDDAAGLVISESLRSQVGGLKVASRNAQDGISVVQTAEGALTEVHSMLQRMRDLAVQASNSGANGGATGDSVAAAKAEFDQLKSAMGDIADQTQFNGVKLLDGNTPSLTFQVGANTGETLDVNLQSATTATLGVDATKVAVTDTTGASITTGTVTLDDIDFTDDGLGATGKIGAGEALKVIDGAIKMVSTFRGDLGAAQNRLEHTVANLGVAAENLSASESRIRDTDMAEEMTAFSRAQILSQAGTAMLAQANQSSQGVLNLLK
jgi:flagellin